MDNIRYKNLYDALISHIQYTWHVQSVGKEKINCKNINFDLLQVIFGGFALTQVIEDYFKKVTGIYECSIMPEALKQIVEVIATDNGNGYTLGDLMYKDEYTVLEKVRNKLAHGDFIIRDGEIIFEEKKIEGRIKLDCFLQFVNAFETEADLYTLNSPHTKIFNKVANGFEVEKIKTEEDIDLISNNLYRIEIKDVPVNSKNRDFDYIILRNKFYALLENKISNSSVEEIKKYIKKMKHMLKNYGIKITYDIQNIKDLEYYQVVKDKYMNMNNYYQTFAFSNQVNAINNISYNLSAGRYQKLNLRRGFQLNRYFMKKFKDNPNYTIEKILEEENEILKLFSYHLDSTIISLYLVGFSTTYEYGLENGLTQIGKYNLTSIFDGKSFDFSKLELSKLDDPDMLIEHTFNKYLTDAEDFEKTEMEKVNRLKNNLNKKVTQYEANCKNKTKDKQNEFDKEKKDIDNLELELKDKIEKLKEFSSNFDLEKYTKNINIIIHLRNAIAHGNVFVDSYTTDINNTDIIFKDYLDDKVVYERKIKVKDFCELFKIKNVDNIHKFIVDNMKSELSENKPFSGQNAEINLNGEEKEKELVKNY